MELFAWQTSCRIALRCGPFDVGHETSAAMCSLEAYACSRRSSNATITIGLDFVDLWLHLKEARVWSSLSGIWPKVIFILGLP